MLKLWPTYALLFSVSLACAQTSNTYNVTGIIISANTKEPIPNGTIMFSKSKGSLCDSIGRFKIYNLPPGQHKFIFSAFGYDTKDTIVTIVNHDIEGLLWNISTECNQYNSELALKHIHNGKPWLLLQSGIAPIVYRKDKLFEKKYSVLFNDFGCIAGDKVECLIAYNHTVFTYLDRTFGKKWRKEVRNDIIGLNTK